MLVLADDPLVRAGLAAVIEGQPGYAVAGQLPWESGFASSVHLYHPDVLLWDLGWEPSLTEDHLAGLRDLGVPAVLLLSSDALAVEAWNAGARGLLLRDAETPQLLDALSAAVHGLVTVDSSLAAVVHPARDETPLYPAEELT